MSEAMIGLLSAVGVVVVQKAADILSARITRKDQKADKNEEKEDKVMKEIQEIKKEIREIKNDQQALSREVKDNRAIESRIRILRFEDEIQHEVRHSEDHFKQIIEDINTYKSYCDAHPDFHNGIGHHATEHILSVYDKCAKEHKFYMEERPLDEEE